MDTPQFAHELAQLRQRIDAIDAVLLEPLAQRAAVSAAIGRLKRTQGLPVYDPARESELIGQRADQAAEAGLPRDWTAELFARILAGCRAITTTQLAGEDAPSDRRCA